MKTKSHKALLAPTQEQKTAARVERFWSKVKRGREDECWEWQAGRVPGGYGRVRHTGRAQLAHRVAWELHNGVLPEGKDLCHSCDNPGCCNPAHLFVGSVTDNLIDCTLKGRLPFAKLKAAQIPEIRRLAKEGMSQNELAQRFNVSVPTISRVLSGRIWSYVK